MNFLAISGCDTTLWSSQGVTTQLIRYAMHMEILVFLY